MLMRAEINTKQKCYAGTNKRTFYKHNLSHDPSRVIQGLLITQPHLASI